MSLVEIYQKFYDAQVAAWQAINSNDREAAKGHLQEMRDNEPEGSESASLAIYAVESAIEDML